MRASEEHRHRGRAAASSALLVALLALGVVAMHHLAGGDHAASRDTTMASAPMHTSTGQQLVGVHHGAGHDDACMSVLLAGSTLLMLGLAVTGWRRRHDALARQLVRTGGPRPGRGPPRDLLAQLCVLRT